MSVTVKRMVMLFLVLLLLFVILRPGILSLGNGETVFVFRFPGERQPGGSTGADLAQQLHEKHGEDIEYSFRYIGRDFHGVQYMNCIVDMDGQSLLYIAVDDGDLTSSMRARVLWDTLHRRY